MFYRNYNCTYPSLRHHDYAISKFVSQIVFRRLQAEVWGPSHLFVKPAALPVLLCFTYAKDI